VCGWCPTSVQVTRNSCRSHVQCVSKSKP
jgi:hypothetical protein